MKNKVFYVVLVCAVIFLGMGSYFTAQLLSHSSEDFQSEDTWILGIVKEGKFHPVWPEESFMGTIRLTQIQMQEARSPESGEIDLSKHEGSAIMVAGHGGGGGWLYSARVIDSAGPIVTLLVKEKFLNGDSF